MTELHDRWGLPLSTRDDAAASAYQAGLDRLLSYDGGAEEALRAAIEADPGFALAHAALAVEQWKRGRREEAVRSADEAVACAEAASERESRHVAVVHATVSGHGYVGAAEYQAPNQHAVRLALGHLDAYPRDALVLLLTTTLTLFSGDRRRRAALPDLYARLAPAYGDGDWWFVGWYALCRVELREREAAAPLAERALALRPRNPIAAHAQGHVLYEFARYEEAAGFLRSWLPGYARDAAYYSHVSWHYALAELLSGQLDRALEVHSHAIDPQSTQPLRTTLADGVALLWRCQLYYPQEAHRLPWGPMRRYATRVAARPGVPFHDVLAALAMAGARDLQALDWLLDELHILADEGQRLAATLVVPLIEACRAFADDAYERCADLLEPLIGELYRLGGSNQQRDMFEETLVEARLRAGQAPGEGWTPGPELERATARVARMRRLSGRDER